MAKPLPVPNVPPSAQCARVIRSLRALAASPATTPAEYAQRVIDLQHVYVAARDLMDPAYFAAINPSGGGVSFRVMAQRTGLAKSAIQRRVDHGSTLPPLIPAAQDEQISGVGV